ncbi:GNAT family N-acetyltransferase [Corynebacterium aquilae]|uniref:N-acetyltransferase domain-containing protein n=1 Tax=Corynebacterium aquilae DSM 44791 TaxID=1431546 RepID=A0A1L7CHA9_9CORY|nr:GNAT family N-acetyltransferase [Corynebacterium aquilae]APT85238.1 hypothetical protein CAQU_09320 [Corynebacterium aquilae DSM 44791]
MRIIPLELPTNGQHPTALLHSLVMCEGLAIQQYTGVDDLSRSLEQTFGGLANAVGCHIAIYAAFDDESCPTNTTSLPLGITNPAEDPTENTYPLGWIELWTSTEEGAQTTDITLTLNDTLLPLPGQPLNDTAEKVCDALLKTAETHGKPVLQTTLYYPADGDPRDNVIADYLAQHGFSIGITEHISYLPVPSQPLPVNLPDGYALRTFPNIIGDDPTLIDSQLRLFNLVEKEVPSGEMTVDEEHWTFETLQQLHQANIDADRNNHCVLVTDASGAVAFSVFGQSSGARPHVGAQGVTLVDPAYRHKGIGTALKNAVMNHCREVLPNVTRLYTSNAIINDGMLLINQRLGMTTVASSAGWTRRA